MPQSITSKIKFFVVQSLSIICSYVHNGIVSTSCFPFTLNLFICDLIKGAVSRPDYMISSSRMIN